MAKLLKQAVKKADPVSKVLFKNFKQVPVDATLGQVSRLLDKDHFVLVTQSQQCCTFTANASSCRRPHSVVATSFWLLTLCFVARCKPASSPCGLLSPRNPLVVDSGADTMLTKTSVHSIVTRIDLLNFIMANEESGSAPGSPTRPSAKVGAV